jgi:hypothetical protein
MTNPTITIHNVETGEVIERDLNETELAQLAIDQERAQATKQAETEKAAEKVALLAKLGITDDEAKLLLS